jgi:hypothetical protein
MHSNPYARMAAIAAGAVTIFGLQHWLEYSMWIALSGAILVYAATVVGVGYLLGVRAK